MAVTIGKYDPDVPTLDADDLPPRWESPKQERADDDQADADQKKKKEKNPGGDGK